MILMSLIVVKSPITPCSSLSTSILDAKLANHKATENLLEAYRAGTGQYNVCLCLLSINIKSK